jgi:hypothetical protein
MICLFDMELRKLKTRKKRSEFLKPIIQIPADAKDQFVVSAEVVKMLKINVTKHGLMFRYSKGRLTAFKEPKSDESYNLSKYHEHSYRFKSKDLYGYFKDIFPDTKFLLMDESLEFKKINK